MPSDRLQFIQLALGNAHGYICAGPEGCGGLIAVNGIELHELFHERLAGVPDVIEPRDVRLTAEQASELGDMGPATTEPDVPADQGNKGESK